MLMRKPSEKRLKYLHDYSTRNKKNFRISADKNVVLIHHSFHPAMNRNKTHKNTLNVSIFAMWCQLYPESFLLMLSSEDYYQVIYRFCVALYELGITISFF